MIKVHSVVYCPSTTQNENNLGQMYPDENQIKDTIENDASASYIDLLMLIGRELSRPTSNDQRNNFTILCMDHKNNMGQVLYA